jgi:hypothetical protein
MLIVADSSALIALAVCDGLDVILKVYDDLKIPEAVYEEIVAPEKPHSDALGALLADRVVKVDLGKWWWLWAVLVAEKLKPWLSTNNWQRMHC